MAKINVYNMDGTVKEELELSEIFSCEYNEAVIHQAVVARLANERQGTKSTLTSSEVRGGGIKPWRQKGTGRARQGSIRAPQWIKGGVVFAPKSRDFSKKMNITAKRVALFSALSKKVADNEIIVLDDITVTGKTKGMATLLKTFNLDKRTLLVMADGNELVRRSAANIEKLSTLPVEQINTYDVVANQKILTTVAVIKKLEEVYGE